MKHELKDKMSKVISSNLSQSENLDACTKAAREYAAKILMHACMYKTRDGNAMYTNIQKIRMAVLNGEL